jgi:hypothetical protein
MMNTKPATIDGNQARVVRLHELHRLSRSRSGSASITVWENAALVAIGTVKGLNEINNLSNVRRCCNRVTAFVRWVV